MPRAFLIPSRFAIIHPNTLLQPNTNPLSSTPIISMPSGEPQPPKISATNIRHGPQHIFPRTQPGGNKHPNQKSSSNRCFSIGFHATPPPTLTSECIHHRNANLAINGFSIYSILIPEYFPQNPTRQNNTSEQTSSSNTCLSRILNYPPSNPIRRNNTLKQTLSSNNYFSISSHATPQPMLASDCVHHRHVNLAITSTLLQHTSAMDPQLLSPKSNVAG